MATTRKDLRGRTLRKGEMQRSSDKRYAYSYTDPLGRRKYIYANDLVTLREKEAQLTKDQISPIIRSTATGGRCSRYCWEQASALVKRWACAGMIWTMSGALSVSITVWPITRWAKAAIRFCTSQSLKRKQAFGRFRCLIP